MRRLIIVAVIAAAAATASPAGAQNECKGIQKCIPVGGPWVYVHGTAETQFLLSCGTKGVVAGVDALATNNAVRISWDGRIGSPVSPGVSTTRSVLFRGLVTGRAGAFEPWIGCVPANGGGGRSTVSARIAPGPSLDLRTRIVVVSPGEVKNASIACLPGEKLVGGWHAIAFRTKRAPSLAAAARVHAQHAIVGRKVVVSVAATDALSIDTHAVVQVGAKCAP
ncbi:MAG TPA: hypothetical protein VGU02_08430 [Gaiellaceae bacterium]|nr:hypothetical protein [Gaiellaceae bacterium]